MSCLGHLLNFDNIPCNPLVLSINDFLPSIPDNFLTIQNTTVYPLLNVTWQVTKSLPM